MNTIQSDALQQLSGDSRAVALAMALLWTWRPRGASYELLRQLGAQSAAGRAYTQEKVKLAQDALKRSGLLVEQSTRPGYLRLTDDARVLLYRQLLDATPVAALRAALHRAESFKPNPYHWSLWDVGATVALVRLELLAGTPATEIEKIKFQGSRTHAWTNVVHAACFEAFDAALFERIAPAWRWNLVCDAVGEVCSRWRLDLLPVCRWALDKLDTEPAAIPQQLRLQLAEVLLHRGEGPRIASVLAGDDSGASDALRAAVQAQEGRWAEAQAAFELAFRKRQAETGVRKRFLPETLVWFYPLALLAQQTPKHLELAKKFCVAESGSRNPLPADRWGAWAHAVSVRLGDVALDQSALDLSSSRDHVTLKDLWCCLLRAWLGAETVGDSGGRNTGVRREEVIAVLRKRLQACGFHWLDGQVAAAEAVFAGGEAPKGFFTAGGMEAWRSVLASLQALGTETSAVADTRATRMVWSIEVDKQGAIQEIEPMEQKRGARSWNRPKPVPLAKLAGNEKLEPWDAKVVRAIRQDRRYARRYTLDRAAAIAALIGHPAVVMSNAPETTVDVVEGTPEMEVAREGERYVMRVTPQMRAEPAADPYGYYADEDERRELDALRYITVVRDSPQRVRVIRLTPAQRRAAQLVSGRFSVPAAAQTELQQALQSLAGHFQIQSDHAEAARELTAESRLRAELAPMGASLMLRLVVAPLGPDGPRLKPGGGRSRVMAAVNGETVGAQRDLDAERIHLDSVLAAFDFLDPPARGDIVCEWVVDEPDQGLAMVEMLPQLPGVQGVDWPRGQPVRVITVDAARLGLTVRTERDWFKLEGRAHLDKGLVFELEALLAAAGGRSRFVPMGKGVYAALTKELREKLVELAAVAESDGADLRVPQIAATWLNEVLEGVAADTDAGFLDKIERLRAAQETLPALPGSLQAELRPYQEDGYL